MGIRCGWAGGIEHIYIHRGILTLNLTPRTKKLANCPGFTSDNKDYYPRRLTRDVATANPIFSLCPSRFRQRQVLRRRQGDICHPHKESWTFPLSPAGIFTSGSQRISSTSQAKNSWRHIKLAPMICVTSFIRMFRVPGY